MKEVKLFSNSGIQYFFGKEQLSVKDIDVNVFDSYKNTWIPLSLDNKRTLLRVALVAVPDNKIEVIFAMDTMLRDGDKSEMALTGDDVGSILPNTLPFCPFMPKDTEDFFNTIPNNNLHIHTAQEIYESILEILHEKSIVPKISILTDHDIALTPLDVTLSLDIGNSRSIGLFIETYDGKVDFKNATPLSLIDHNKLLSTSLTEANQEISKLKGSYIDDHMISSNITLKMNPFNKFVDGEDGSHFNYPSVVKIGHHYDTSEARCSLSGPKRYLWDNDKSERFWQFDNKKALRGNLFKYIPPDDTNIKSFSELKHEFLKPNPDLPIWPKRAFMIFTMIEIIFQAITQVNSIRYRSQAGEPNRRRKLTNIVLSFPSGMPLTERDQFKEQANKALNILIHMNSINKDENLQIELGSDEATCTQIPFIYDQLNSPLGSDVNLFLNLSQGDNKSMLRVATIDIGGGTTDLSICEYTQDGDDKSFNLKQSCIYSDGITKAGDDIVKKILEECFFEPIRLHLKEHNNDDFIDEHYGSGAGRNNKEQRINDLKNIFYPIALFYLKILEKEEDSIFIDDIYNNFKGKTSVKNIVSKAVSLDIISEEIKENSLSSEWWSNTWGTTHQQEIDNLFPSIDKLKKCVKAVLAHELENFSFVINAFSPSFLLLGGKTSSLPIVKEIISKTMILPESKIIPLSNHFIGDWYPFIKNNKVSDAKTGVVVGNAIANASNKFLLSNNIRTQGENSNFTLYFLGYTNDTRLKLTNNNIVYRWNNGDSQRATVRLNNTLNFICRNVDDEFMSCNMMYELRFVKEKKIRAEGIIEVEIDFSKPKNLTSDNIINVKGKVFNADAGPSSSRDIELGDVEINEKTLLESEYYLDSGVFDFGMI